MELLKDVLVLLLLLSASVLCITSIYYFYRIVKAIEALQSDLQKMSGQINPLLDTLNILSKSVKSLSDDFRLQLQKVHWIIDEVKSRVEAVISIEERIRGTIENPAQNIIGTIQAIKNGISTFFQTLKK